MLDRSGLGRTGGGGPGLLFGYIDERNSLCADTKILRVSFLVNPKLRSHVMVCRSRPHFKL